MKTKTTGLLHRQTDPSKIIEYFEMELDPVKFKPEEIIHMSEGIGVNKFEPMSRVEALKIPLSNIQQALKRRNIITGEGGMIGMISPEGAKDGDAYIPFSEKESEKSREKLQRDYGLDAKGGHVAIMTKPMRWTPMTFDIHQLGLLEGTEDDFSQIIAAFRHDRDHYPSTKGATFENKAAGARSTVQFGLQPLADKLMRQWTKHFLDPTTGEKLIACYDHLPVMKEDEVKRTQADLTENQKLQAQYESGVINLEQYKLAIGDNTPIGPDDPKNAAQAKLRSLVGGVNGILNTNTLVAQKFLDPATAARIIEHEYGFSPITSARLVTTFTVDPGTPAPALSGGGNSGNSNSNEQ
jgi:hypothetical protein